MSDEVATLDRTTAGAPAPMLVATETPIVTPTTPTLFQRFVALDRAQRIKLAAGLVLVVVIGIAAVLLSRPPEWKVLFSNLSDKDGGAVIAQLSTMNVPYKYTEGGGAIMVPNERVHDVRLKLASLGLPKGSVAGFEAMESNRFGMTQFQERLTFQRGLEGELVRSIQSISAVESARVHLALPNQNGFFREQQKPSASVLLTLHPGHRLDKTQLAGIVHLVSSSVPEMEPTAVSVLDDSGKLLSGAPDGEDKTADAEQLSHVQKIEQLYSQRILDILEPLVGKQNVRAQVTAELDFSKTDATIETYKPNQTPDTAAVRSKRTLEDINGPGTPAPAGIPGATTNQPPAQPSAPINGDPQTLTAAGQGTSGTGTSATTKKEATTNYEVDRTVQVVKGSSGVIKRLSAAVVVNHQAGKDDKGTPITIPLSDEQVEKMTALVREAIGFNQDRGDSVNLMNAAFAPQEPEANTVPLWRQPEVLEVARSFAWPLGMVLLAGMVFLGVVRPAMKSLTKPPEDPSALVELDAEGKPLNAVEAEELERLQLEGPDGQAQSGEISESERKLNDARQLTRDNPAAVANIVKAWINGEVPG